MAPKKKRERAGPKSKTKVVVRRLPAYLTVQEAEKLVEPFKEEYDYFYFVPAQSSYGDFAFSRFYVNFKAPESVFNFSQAFGHHVFKDAKGNDTRPVVEYSPSQGVPKKRNRGVSKMGTIDKDADYLKFLEDLAKPKGEGTEGTEQQQEEAAAVSTPQTTPLLEFLRAKKQEKAAAAEASAAEKKKKKRESTKEGRSESKTKEKDRDKDKERKSSKPADKLSSSSERKSRPSDKERSESKSRRSDRGDRGEGSESHRSERRPQAEKTASAAEPTMRILKKSDPSTPKDDRPRDTPSTLASSSDSAKKPSDGRLHARATTRDTPKPSHGSGDRASRGASSEGKEAAAGDDDAKKKDRKDRAPERAIYKPPRSKATLVSRSPATKKETGGGGSSGGAAPATKPS